MYTGNVMETKLTVTDSFD